MIRQWLFWTLLLPLFCLMPGGEARAQAPAPAVSCTPTTNNIEFGQLDIYTEAPKTVGSVTITCTGLQTGSSALVCIGLPYPAGMPNAYPMGPATNNYDLFYKIYTTEARTTAWPQGPFDAPFGNWPNITVTANNTPVTQSFYAALIPNQSVSRAGIKTGTLDILLRIITYQTTVPSCSDIPTIRASTSLTASATVNRSCNITATPMEFPPQTVITKDVLAENTLTVLCTMDTDYWVSLDNGTNADGTQRRMQNQDKPGNFINYDLYRDSARLSRWGLVVKNNDVPTGTCNCLTGYSSNFTVYGKIPRPEISPRAGLYKDTITATVDF